MNKRIGCNKRNWEIRDLVEIVLLRVHIQITNQVENQIRDLIFNQVRIGILVQERSVADQVRNHLKNTINQYE